MVDYTTIRVSKHTKDRLKRLGGKGSSYDDIINGILDVLEDAGVRPSD